VTLLALLAAVLVAAAARELLAARGERVGGVIGRRVRSRLRHPSEPLGPAAMVAGAERRLRDAGIASRLTPLELLVAKAAAATASVPLAAAAAPAAPGRLGLLVLIGVPVAAFVAPDLLVEGAARRRRARVAAELPDALDLMATGAGSGRSVGRLLEEAMRTSTGPLREELAATVAAMECGSSRAQTLRELGERSRGTTLAGLAAALERSRRHGSPLARALHEQAGSLRAEQRREVTERAARAAPKMQLVVALLLVPSVLLMVAAAIVANSGSLLPGF
jgi:tight adherence protein C